MNRYTPFPGELTLSPPGTFNDTRFFYFFLRADPQALQECCNRYLNDRLPAGGLFYKSFGVVALAFTHVDELIPADAACGVTTYKDIAFWIPVMASEPDRPPRLCLFPPCIYVDDAATMATGREIFGLPKQMGRFEMPLSPEEIPHRAAPQFRLEVVGTLQDGGARDFRTIATITARPGVGRVSMVRKAMGLFNELTAVLEAKSVFSALSLPDALTTLTAVGLKQFRDVARCEESCHTAIVEAPLRMKERPRDDPHFFLTGFDVDLESEPVPSHPVCATLGLKPGRQTVLASVYFRANMEMQAGRVVWRQP